MYGKLALRNVRRQVGSYLIYFITVSLTVAMMFGLHNVLYSPQLQEFARTVDSMRTGLLVLSICIALVVAFVLGFAFFRLKQYYFTFASIGLMTILNGVFMNWEAFSGGAGHLPGDLRR